MPAKKKKVTSKSKNVKTKKSTAKTNAKKTSANSKKVSPKAKAAVKTQSKKQAKVKTKTKTTKTAKTKTPKTTKATKSVKVTKAKPKKTVKTTVKEKPARRVSSPATEVVKKTMNEINVTHLNIMEVVEPKKYRVKSSATIVGSLNFTPYHLSKDEEYMNAAQLKHFENILILWKQQLMYEVDSTVGHMKEDVMSYPDPLDRAAQEEGFNLELRTRDRERKLIKKIEQALDMIKNGEYGYCEDCGAEIGIRRLEARPTADKCIDCKTYEEIREKQVGGQ